MTLSLVYLGLASKGRRLAQGEAASARFASFCDEAARSADVGKGCSRPIAKGIEPLRMALRNQFETFQASNFLAASIQKMYKVELSAMKITPQSSCCIRCDCSDIYPVDKPYHALYQKLLQILKV